MKLYTVLNIILYDPEEASPDTTKLIYLPGPSPGSPQQSLTRLLPSRPCTRLQNDGVLSPLNAIGCHGVFARPHASSHPKTTSGELSSSFRARENSLFSQDTFL